MAVIFMDIGCRLTRNKENQWLREREIRHEQIHDLLRATDSTLVEMRECEFYDEMKQNHWLKAEYEDQKLPLSGDMTVEQLINAIRYRHCDGRTMAPDVPFGIVEVDLQIPWWDPGLREEMAAFLPIFKNTKISLDDIGPTMREYAIRNKLMTKARRCLISSYHATKIMLATPYLQWLMQKSAAVTRLYQFIQYTPTSVFSGVVDEITNYRRQADADPSTKSAETYKKIGNSMYGKFLTKVEKHNNVKYAKREEAQEFVMSPLFRKAEHIGGGVFEIHMAKKKIRYDLPIEIPFFVYQYAKLRMCEYYHDFLAIVAPGNFELLEMDTDLNR